MKLATYFILLGLVFPACHNNLGCVAGKLIGKILKDVFNYKLGHLVSKDNPFCVTSTKVAKVSKAPVTVNVIFAKKLHQCK